MGSSDAGTREGAASALRTIMTLKARGGDRWVPPGENPRPVRSDQPMIAGLDDSDEMVRYFSVCTMMEINDNPIIRRSFFSRPMRRLRQRMEGLGTESYSCTVSLFVIALP